MECEYCIEDFNFNIKVADIITKCKYHKVKGALYKPFAAAPKGLCRQLFYSVYPDCLAVLYNGVPRCGKTRVKGMREIVSQCPAPCGVKARIKSKEMLPSFLRVCKELVEEVLKKFIRAFDGPFRNVEIEIIDAGNCPKGYKRGDKFRFNISKQNELCPAGFFACYPYFRFLKEEKEQNGKAAPICVHCHDYVGVIYEVNAV